MLRISIAKRADGIGVLSCTRPDGSVTWQKLERNAAHFALHDLTHLAVESALKINRGFFGLIASGWDIADTNGKGTRGPLPSEAIEVEMLVGGFDGERALGISWSAEEFNDMQALKASGGDMVAPRKLLAEELDRVRVRRAELFRQWAATPAGGKLELTFP